MHPEIIVQPQAELDLIDHFEYLALHANEATARKFLNSIMMACELLSEMPELGSVRRFKRKDLRNIRLWPLRDFREYLLFYKPLNTGITLIRLIHAKEDYMRKFE